MKENASELEIIYSPEACETFIKSNWDLLLIINGSEI